jgi:hypothetical protein
MNKEINMLFKFIFFASVLLFSILMIGCSGTPTANSTNANSSNTNATANSSDPLDTTKKPVAETTNNAPTLGPVVQAYYEGLRKKDNNAVRGVMSQEFLQTIEADMKDEKRTDLAAYMAEYDTIPDKPVEVRNERIDGDKAVAEIKGGAYVNWTPFEFVKENGVWKFTGGSADIQTMQPANSSK